MQAVKRIRPEEYTRAFFLSDYLEGYRDFEAGHLSVVKTKQLEMLALARGITLLEVGFGRGELLYHCAKRGASVTGIDYAPDAYEIAQATLREFPDADIRIADCRELPFDAATFERVFSGDVIEHLCFEDGVLMLKEMFRVLKPGGFMLVHTTPNTVFTNWVYPAARLFLKRVDRDTIKNVDDHLGMMHRLHIYEYDLFSLKAVARAAGLRSARVWIDDDVLRSRKHRHTQALSKNPLVSLAAFCSKFSPVRFLLGNDLYLRVAKE